MNVQTVAVIGANGSMGRNVCAIFASFGQARVYMVSRRIDDAVNSVEKAVQSVRADSIRNNLIPVSYAEMGKILPLCDLIFDSTKEDMDVKKTVLSNVSEILKSNGGSKIGMICTGTSGLSLTELASALSPDLRRLFFGMHFFNPPYNMPLCELVPTSHTDENIFAEALKYCREKLNRVVVKATDTPAFLGNRIGFQFINSAMQYAEKYRYNGGIDYIDAIFRGVTGRNMAPLVTADFVGLDVHKAIVDNIYRNTHDFCHDTFRIPEFTDGLIREGKLGKKAGSGLYRTEIKSDGRKIRYVYDIETGKYREVNQYRFTFQNAMMEEIRSGNYREAFNILHSNHSTEAEICKTLLEKYILYSIVISREVSEGINSADDAMAAGFKWCPPLALVEVMGNEYLKERFQTFCKDTEIQGIDLSVCMQKSQYDYRKYLKAVD